MQNGQKARVVSAKFMQPLPPNIAPENTNVVVLVSPEMNYFNNPLNMLALYELLRKNFRKHPLFFLIGDSLQRHNYLSMHKLEDSSPKELAVAKEKAITLGGSWKKKHMQLFEPLKPRLISWDQCLVSRDFGGNFKKILDELPDSSPLSEAIKETASDFTKAKFHGACAHDPTASDETKIFEHNSQRYVAEECAVLLSAFPAWPKGKTLLVYPNKPTPALEEAIKISNQLGNQLTWLGVTFRKREHPAQQVISTLRDFFDGPEVVAISENERQVLSEIYQALAAMKVVKNSESIALPSFAATQRPPQKKPLSPTKSTTLFCDEHDNRVRKLTTPSSLSWNQEQKTTNSHSALS